MKIRILDRILVALAGLLMIAGVAAVAAQLFFGRNVAGKVTEWLNNDSLRIYIIIAGILLCAVGIYCVLLLFRHKGRNGKFIMQRTESGELAISLKALESMVQKCLEQHKELSAQTVSLDNEKGSLLVRISGTVAGGISIPLTVDTLQQQIKQYVTACSGVEVKDIRVEIESSGPDATDAPFAIEAPAAKGLLKGAAEQPITQEEQKPAETGETETAEPATAADIPDPDAANVQAEDEFSAAAAAAAMLIDKAPAEDDDRPMHQRIFSMVEEPCVMPMPPKDLEETQMDEGKPEVKEAQEETGREESKTTEESTAGESRQQESGKEGPEPPDAKAEEPKAEETGTEEPKPAKAKVNWFRNKKAKGKHPETEEVKDEVKVPAEEAAADVTAEKEATEIKVEGGIED